jgi:LacI family transcriptional regulator
VRHLLDIGHTRIGIIDSANPLGNQEKRDGYLAALAEAGIAFDSALSSDPQGHSVIRGYWAMDRLMRLSPRPTAVFAANDSLAIGALRWTQKNKIAVPDEVGIVGFDNIEFAEHAATPLTSVNYEIRLITDLAVARLLELVGYKDGLPAPAVTLIDPELIVRESTQRSAQS